MSVLVEEMTINMDYKLINEIASNVFQGVFPYQEYMVNNGLKYIKAFPIIIEGLDCVGKNTLSTNLFNELKSKDKNVVLLSFPNYKSESGMQIRELLLNPNRHIIQEQELSALMIRNRMETLMDMRNDIDTEENEGKEYIIILDRFFLSNFAYSAEYKNQDELLAFMQESPLYKLTEFESDCYFPFFNNNGKGISVILSYNENDPDKHYDENIMKSIVDSKKLHKDFLDKKLEKDAYENMNKQQRVSSIYDIYGIDRTFHKVEHFLRFRPIETLSEDQKNKVIPSILELI